MIEFAAVVTEKGIIVTHMQSTLSRQQAIAVAVRLLVAAGATQEGENWGDTKREFDTLYEAAVT